LSDIRIGRSRIVCYMPAYNAARHIEGVISMIPPEFWSFLGALLIVDDGSTDDTSALAARLCSERPAIKVLTHRVNRGYGGAQKTAFQWALDNEFDAAVMLHSDGQYPPSLLRAMLEPMEIGAEVVGGSRTLHGGMREGGMSLARYCGTVGLNALENLVLRQSLTSYHSGYKAYSRKAIESIPFVRYSETFNFDSEMLIGAARAHLRIAEVPIPTIHGKGFSSLRPIPYGLSVLRTLAKYILGRI
jgi:glycosyltransferase involved in cell wall biosynthesis